MCRKMPLSPFCLKVHAHANVGCIVNHSIHTVSSDVGYTQKLFTLWGYNTIIHRPCGGGGGWEGGEPVGSGFFDASSFPPYLVWSR